MRFIIAIAAIGLMSGCASTQQSAALPQPETVTPPQAMAVVEKQSAAEVASASEAKPAADAASDGTTILVHEIKPVSSDTSNAKPSGSYWGDAGFNPVQCIMAWVNGLESQSAAATYKSGTGE